MAKRDASVFYIYIHHILFIWSFLRIRNVKYPESFLPVQYPIKKITTRVGGVVTYWISGEGW